MLAARRLARALSAAPAPDGAARAAAMRAALTAALQPTRVEVADVSGGCGDFFKVLVVAPRFAGVPTVRAHREVLAVLEADVGKMHGLTIVTRARDDA